MQNIAEENRKGIANHKSAAMFFQLAAKYHLLAAENHEEGNHDKAFENTYHAQLQSALAEEYQQKDIIHHGKEYQSFLTALK